MRAAAVQSLTTTTAKDSTTVVSSLVPTALYTERNHLMLNDRWQVTDRNGVVFDDVPKTLNEALHTLSLVTTHFPEDGPFLLLETNPCPKQA